MKEALNKFFTESVAKSIEGQKPSLKNLLSRALLGKLKGEKTSLKDLLYEGERLESHFGQWKKTVTKESYEATNPDPNDPENPERFYTEVQGPYGNPYFVIERIKAFDLPQNTQSLVTARGESIDLENVDPEEIDKQLKSLVFYSYKDLEGNLVTHRHKIGGIICQSKDGAEHDPKHDPRSSLSNPNFREVTSEADLQNAAFVDEKNNPVTYWQKTEDGIQTFQMIDGARVDRNWYLRAVLLKDKNRFGNYDAYYSLNKPDAVKVVELADLTV